MMPEVTERFLLLERYVQRAIELVETLRAENGRLAEERAALARRMDTLTAEIDALRQRGERLLHVETEHRQLVEERQQLLGQVESMLKELARIEGL